MCRTLCVLTLAFICAFLGAPVQPAAQVATPAATPAAEENLIGQWTGTFSGASAGKFTMSIARTTDKLGGSLDTQFEAGGGYTATFKTVRAEGPKVAMAYDSPNGDPVEIQMSATLEGRAIKGTWQVVETASKTVVQTGEFTGAKQ